MDHEVMDDREVMDRGILDAPATVLLAVANNAVSVLQRCKHRSPKYCRVSIDTATSKARPHCRRHCRRHIVTQTAVQGLLFRDRGLPTRGRCVTPSRSLNATDEPEISGNTNGMKLLVRLCEIKRSIRRSVMPR